MGYGRWRFESGPAGQGQQFAMVDRLCVLKEYRQKGYARACLERIVQDVSAQTAEVGAIVLCCRKGAVVAEVASGVCALPCQVLVLYWTFFFVKFAFPRPPYVYLLRSSPFDRTLIGSCR